MLKEILDDDKQANSDQKEPMAEVDASPIQDHVPDASQDDVTNASQRHVTEIRLSSLERLLEEIRRDSRAFSIEIVNLARTLARGQRRLSACVLCLSLLIALLAVILMARMGARRHCEMRVW